MAQHPITILLITADPATQAQLNDVLSSAPLHTYSLSEATSGAEGLRQWYAQSPDCVLLDDRLPDLSALHVLETLVQATSGTAPVVLLINNADADMALEALQRGAQDCLATKHLTTFDVQRAIANTIEKVHLRRAQEEATVALRACEQARSQHADAEVMQTLREREQFISAVLSTTPNLIYVHDLVKDKTIYLNDQIEQLFGYTFSALKALGGNVFVGLAHPRDLSGMQAHMERLRQADDDTVIEHEFRIRHHDGSWHWLSSHDRIFERDCDGAVRTVLGIAIDISARKQAEERLLLFEQVVLNMNDALLITEAEPIDEPGPRIVYANPAFTRTTGYTLEEVLGKNPRFLQGPNSARVELDKVRQALKDWKSTRVELTNYRKDGSTFEVELDVSPVADATGWYTHWISVQREVSTRKRAEVERAELLAQAQAARAQAEVAVEVRDQFLSIAAHELKNPLTALLANAELLDRRIARGGEISEREQRMVHAIHEQGDRLNTMITTLLDVSRIEMGQLPISLVPLDLGALVQRIVEELRPALTRHTLDYTGPAEALVLPGDGERLEQVVQNLLGNAIKYSPGGGIITIQVERHADWGCIIITDEGIGIPQDALPNLFQRFYRAPNVQRSQIVGTGVGLYVIKEIVARHGGEVRVQSTERVGSTFTVFLPLHTHDHKLQ